MSPLCFGYNFEPWVCVCVCVRRFTPCCCCFTSNSLKLKVTPGVSSAKAISMNLTLQFRFLNYQGVIRATQHRCLCFRCLHFPVSPFLMRPMDDIIMRSVGIFLEREVALNIIYLWRQQSFMSSPLCFSKRDYSAILQVDNVYRSILWHKSLSHCICLMSLFQYDI